jgi:hypothetical protein
MLLYITLWEGGGEEVYISNITYMYPRPPNPNGPSLHNNLGLHPPPHFNSYTTCEELIYTQNIEYTKAE